MKAHSARSRVVAAIGAVALAIVPSVVGAQQVSFGLVLEGVLEMGGDPVAEVLFTDGDTQTMRAGQGGTLAGGVELRSAAFPASLRGTVGFKYSTTAAENVDIKLTRVPLELVGSYHIGDLRMGAGYVRHVAVRFDGGGLGSDHEFEGANGATLELGWRWVALTYTLLEYTDETGGAYDAGGVGLSLIGSFGL